MDSATNVHGSSELLYHFVYKSFYVKSTKYMPGGYGKITGADGNTFSSTNQPARYRGKTKFLTELLKEALQDKEQEIILSGFPLSPVYNARGEVIEDKVEFRITMPTQKAVITALLKKAAKGNTVAIREIFDRIEGKVPLKIIDPDEKNKEVTVRVIRDSKA